MGEDYSIRRSGRAQRGRSGVAVARTAAAAKYAISGENREHARGDAQLVKSWARLSRHAAFLLRGRPLRATGIHRQLTEMGHDCRVLVAPSENARAPPGDPSRRPARRRPSWRG